MFSPAVSLAILSCSQLTYRFNFWGSFEDDSLDSFLSASNSTSQAAETSADDDDLDLALHYCVAGHVYMRTVYSSTRRLGISQK